MVDIPGNNTTTQSIAVDGTLSDTLEVVGDHDWVSIQLTAGQSISVFLDGLSLEDPYLRIRNASGNILYENDDITSGVNRDSLLAFTATYTGTYFVDVGAWEDNYAGTYQLSVSVYTPPPLATVDQIADQLVSGYWGGEQHRFNVTQGGSLTVNLTALTADGQQLARAALAAWTDVIGVNFVEVTSGGQITFDDNQEDAFADSIYSGGFISSSTVNVSTQWLTDYGTTLNSYSFQTYIHEIGHALGLGHAGNYNEEARYPYDALFQNDSWAMSVMSYFDQQENTYFAGLGYANNFAVTPMMADIVAMSTLYGLSTTTRADNTIYGSGWHTNMGALTIFDSGGNDTIDVSGLGGNQRIDLTPGTFSNIMSEVGNVSIARGVIIENARSSSGHDTLIGNDVANVLDSGAGNDTLTGGGGDDWLNAGWGNNIIDGGTGSDTLDYAYGFLAAVTLNLNTGTALNNGGAGSDSFTSIENVRGTTEHDTLIGDSGANVLQGHLGDDTIDGGDGNDTLYGDTTETLSFGGADTLNGGAGADILSGGRSPDRLTGGSGDDSFVDTRAGLEGDTITDFARGDRIVISDASLAGFSFTLSGSTLTYTGGWLTLTGFTGTLIASAAAAGGVQLTLEPSRVSSGGDDILTGTASADILDGLTGADTIYGRAGDDIISADRSIGFDNGSDIDTLFGEGGNDSIFAGYGDIVDGGDGFDVVYVSYIGGNAGINGDTATLFAGQPLVAGGGTLSNIESFATMALTRFSDTMVVGDQSGHTTVYAWEGDDTITGQRRSVTFHGGDGNDLLVGGISDDVLNGDNGDDRLIGGEGRDVLSGGAGRDRFFFVDLDLQDRILDFQAGTDRIDLTAIDANVFQAGDQAFTFVGDANFSAVAGQLRGYWGATNTYFIAGDVNGDGIADLVVEVGGTLPGSQLNSADFLF
ncbi:MAG: M10 family metallopeptidase C-terminal domain-containing protein [Sphingomicrobium sp.]